MNASKMMKKMASSFWTPWNVRFPSLLVRSNLTSPEPFISWSRMDAVTMGPMPRCIKLPDWPARMARKEAKMSSRCCETPNSSMFERAKYSRRQSVVQRSLVWNETCPSGLRTAGQRLIRGSSA